MVSNEEAPFRTLRMTGPLPYRECMTWVNASAPRGVTEAVGHPVLRSAGALATVHVGQSLCLFESDKGRLVPVTDGRHGLVPGGLCLTVPGDLTRIANLARSGGVDIAPWRDLPRERVTVRDLRVLPGPLSRRAADALFAAALVDGREVAGPMGSSRQRADATALACAVIPGDAAATSQVLRRLIGSGPGSTPAGDDVVVGVLAALHRSGRGVAGLDLLRELLPPLLPRTVAVSRHALTHALTGDLPERTHELLAGLARPDRVSATLAAARTWGASSGLDMACGAAAVATVLGTEVAPGAASPVGTTRRSVA